MTDPYSLDGRHMRVVASDADAVVSAGTRLIFSETDAVISARYYGGTIKLGYLVGRRSDERDLASVRRHAWFRERR